MTAEDTPEASAATEAATSTKLKVVYHVDDLDQVSFVLGDVQNHLDGVGGPDHVTMRRGADRRAAIAGLPLSEALRHPRRQGTTG